MRSGPADVANERTVLHLDDTLDGLLDLVLADESGVDVESPDIVDDWREAQRGRRSEVGKDVLTAQRRPWSLF